MTLKVYHGSCRCGKIKFEVKLDLAEGTSKCNCTYCWKTRWWGARARPDTFQLTAGGEELGYGFGRERFIERALCLACKVTPFGWGNVPEIGGDYISVNLACLDDVEPAELIAAPVRFLDGRNDNWFHEPAETRHL
jgi:hypothetical protein